MGLKIVHGDKTSFHICLGNIKKHSDPSKIRVLIADLESSIYSAGYKSPFNTSTISKNILRDITAKYTGIKKIYLVSDNRNTVHKKRIIVKRLRQTKPLPAICTEMQRVIDAIKGGNKRISASQTSITPKEFYRHPLFKPTVFPGVLLAAVDDNDIVHHVHADSKNYTEADIGGFHALRDIAGGRNDYYSGNYSLDECCIQTGDYDTMLMALLHTDSMHPNSIKSVNIQLSAGKDRGVYTVTAGSKTCPNMFDLVFLMFGVYSGDYTFVRAKDPASSDDQNNKYIKKTFASFGISKNYTDKSTRKNIGIASKILNGEIWKNVTTPLFSISVANGTLSFNIDSYKALLRKCKLDTKKTAGKFDVFWEFTLLLVWSVIYYSMFEDRKGNVPNDPDTSDFPVPPGYSTVHDFVTGVRSDGIYVYKYT